ncbi:MAG: cytochrome C [Deltaproteobacteria bacterium]|nr:cytochrome C [Deltaproteobacteria bacterium]
MVVAIVSLIFATTSSFAGITGSVHDFSTQGWSAGRICTVCHTPHNASQTIAAAPLWNHKVTTATYTLYTSPTMDETTVQPLGISKLCLSCHDGTLAVDSFGDQTGSTFISGEANIGTDLSNDHPISVSWTHQTIVGFGPQCTNCHDQIGEDPSKFVLPFYKYAGGPAKIECSSCHDPHNNGPPNEKLLRMSNNGSALCLTCHNR